MSSVGLQRQSISVALSVVLVFAVIGSETGAMAYQNQDTQPAASTGSSSDYAGQGTPASAEELQSLVAPIALYPDALVAQILSAATFPDQVAVADYWVQQNKTLTGSALMAAVDKQTWDPSVKALTQFPSVLDNMAKNLSWTSQLGEAYHNQQADVMSAVQTLRAKAKTAGNLKSGSQITVVQQSPQTIVIQPTNPQVVYVPQYNPTVIYGTTYITPGYSTGDLVATGLLSFGAGMAVGAMMSGGCCGWGYSSWNCNWGGGAVYYHGGAYYGNNAWHGGYYGSGYNNSGYHPYNNGYNNSGYHSNYNNGYNSSGYHANNVNNSGYNRTGQNNYSHNTNVSGNTVNMNRQDTANRAGSTGSWDQHASSGGWGSSDAARGWGSRSDSGGSTAFSGWGNHSGSSSFGGGGWGSRASSSRGWGSRGGGGGWGGGGFRGGGGGFRR